MSKHVVAETFEEQWEASCGGRKQSVVATDQGGGVSTQHSLHRSQPHPITCPPSDDNLELKPPIGDDLPQRVNIATLKQRHVHGVRSIACISPSYREDDRFNKSNCIRSPNAIGYVYSKEIVGRVDNPLL